MPQTVFRLRHFSIALGNESLFEYNLNDQLVKVTLHRVDTVNNVDSNEVTLYEYDGRNLVTKTVNALGDVALMVYDGNGNLVSKTDEDGYVTEYTYNSLNLISAINYNEAKSVSYAYNKVGELVKMDDWTGTNTFEMDLLGQLKKVTDHKGNVTEYTYSPVGEQTAIKYPDNAVVQNTYDAVGNLLTTKDGEGYTSTYTYDDMGRASSLTYPNGWKEQYTYDAEGNLLKTMDTDPTKYYGDKTTKKFEYKYDAEGNVTWEWKRDNGEAGLVSCSNYTYDALNRLTSDQRSGDYTKDKPISYTYDSLGNLVQEKRDGTNVTAYVNTWQYNDLNEMTGKQVCNYTTMQTGITDYSYKYDKRGNLIEEWEICAPTSTGKKDVLSGSYLYDETNRMVQGKNKAGEASLYTFNGLGVRVGTELIVKDNTYGYTDFHCETPSIETGLKTPEVVKADYVPDYTRLDIDQRDLMKKEVGPAGYDFRYVYGNDKLSVKVTSEGSDWWGQTIQKNITKLYYMQDKLGSTVNMTDGYGYKSCYASYNAWGELKWDNKDDSLTVEGGYRMLYPQTSYTGHDFDLVLNQYYAKARMYSAANKRFNALDPIMDSSRFDLTVHTGTPMMFVQYLYVDNNPLVFVDPLGLLKLNGTDIKTAVQGSTLGFANDTSLYMTLNDALGVLSRLGYVNDPNSASPYPGANLPNRTSGIQNRSDGKTVYSLFYENSSLNKKGNIDFEVKTAVGANGVSYYFVKLSCIKDAVTRLGDRLTVREENIYFSNSYDKGKRAAGALADDILYNKSWEPGIWDTQLGTHTYWMSSIEFTNQWKAIQDVNASYNSSDFIGDVIAFLGTTANEFYEAYQTVPDPIIAGMMAIGKATVGATLQDWLDPDGAYLDPYDRASVFTMLGDFVNETYKTDLGKTARNSVEAYLATKGSDWKYYMHTSTSDTAPESFNNDLASARENKIQSLGVLAQFGSNYINGLKDRTREILDVNEKGTVNNWPSVSKTEIDKMIETILTMSEDDKKFGTMKPI